MLEIWMINKILHLCVRPCQIGKTINFSIIMPCKFGMLNLDNNESECFDFKRAKCFAIGIWPNPFSKNIWKMLAIQFLSRFCCTNDLLNFRRLRNTPFCNLRLSSSSTDHEHWGLYKHYISIVYRHLPWFLATSVSKGCSWLLCSCKIMIMVQTYYVNDP